VGKRVFDPGGGKRVWLRIKNPGTRARVGIPGYTLFNLARGGVQRQTLKKPTPNPESEPNMKLKPFEDISGPHRIM